MKLTNDSYLILMGTKNFTERYYRDEAGSMKVSARGRTFRMTAEQVLNHVLPALAGVKRGLTVKVEHRESHEATRLTDAQRQELEGFDYPVNRAAAATDRGSRRSEPKPRGSL